MKEKHTKEYRRLGLTIAFYRKMRGFTQVQLAELVDLSRTHISNIEAPNMNTSISLDKLLDISDALDVPIARLFDFKDQ